MSLKPYVGITGPVNSTEVRLICRKFADAGYDLQTPHIPMLGFLVSYKTLNGQLTDNRRYPAVSDLNRLLELTYGNVLSMIHYNSRELDLSGQIKRLFSGLRKCKAVQLNIVWPAIEEVTRMKEEIPELQVVLQLSHRAMEEDVLTVVRKVQDYNDSIDYALIDPSGGRALQFDLDTSVALYTELRLRCPNLTIGFAGGFTGDNVAQRLEQLIERTKTTEFCIDAEGGLRDKVTERYGDDLLNASKVRKYLQSAHSVLH